VGQVGSGFTEELTLQVLDRLREIREEGPPIDDPELAAVKGATWARPELVCDVEYLHVTKAGKLRAPSFKGLRPDKSPQDCVLEEAP